MLSLENKISWLEVSNALDKSKNTPAVASLWSIADAIVAAKQQ